MFRYCYASRNKSTDKNKIYIDKNEENKIILKNVKAIKIGDIIKNVISYKEDDTYIQLELESDATEFDYPNVFEVIK